MEKSKFLLVAMGMLALGLTSCSDDAPVVPDNPKAEYDQKQFMVVQISAPSDLVTRAEGEEGEGGEGEGEGEGGGDVVATPPEFENGTTNESFVDHLDFLFYDAAGNPTAAPYPLSNFTTTDFDNNPATSPNVTRICKALVEVNLTQGQNLPSQVICIVNGESGAVNELSTKKLDDLINVERNYFRNGSFFVMTNSVYYGQNVLTGNPESRLCATPININTQLFKMEADAKNATGSAILDIYVERVASKVGLTLDQSTIDGYTLVNADYVPAVTDESGEVTTPAVGSENVTLKFTPEYWAMNATANTNYLTKRYGIDQEPDGLVMLPTYNQINAALTGAGWATWNDPTRFRSYWGCSPSYFDNTYPFVSDDVDDLDATTNEPDYPVTYLSYTDVKNQAARTDDGGIGKQALAATGGSFSISNTGEKTTGYIYTRETTVASTTIRNITAGNPPAAVASAIIVGKYTATGAAVSANGTFYIDRNAGVIGNNTVGTFYGSMASARKSLSDRQRIVYTTYPTTGATAVSPDAGIFTLEHPTKAVRDKAGVKIAGRLVTIQIKTLPAQPIFYYDVNATIEGSTDKGAYVQVTSDNLTEVNAQLLSVGYLDMYNAGHAFFSVPIHHLNWNDQTCLVAQTTGEGESAVTTYGPEYNWQEMPVGALGVVRNHVYTLKVSRIKGLAAGVRSDDQPMVPAKDEYNQYIKANINILAWKIVPEQDVPL